MVGAGVAVLAEELRDDAEAVAALLGGTAVRFQMRMAKRLGRPSDWWRLEDTVTTDAATPVANQPHRAGREGDTRWQGIGFDYQVVVAEAVTL